MTFVYRKGESGKGRKMDGAKTPVAKIQSLAKITFNLRLISHLGECDCFALFMLAQLDDEPFDGMEDDGRGQSDCCFPGFHVPGF